MGLANPAVKSFISSRLSDNSDDEDDDPLNEGGDDTTPYDSLRTDGATAPDTGAPSGPGIPAAAPANKSLSDLQGTASLQDLQGQQSRLDAARAGEREANSVTNYGQALSNLARGGQAPVDNSALYSRIAAQNKEVPEQVASDIKRREDIVKAIQLANAKKSQFDATNKFNEERLSQGKEHNQILRERNDVIGNAQGNRLATTDIRAAASVMKGAGIDKETSKLNSARGAQSLIDDIRAGKLTDSKNISSQLTNLIKMIEMGSPGGVSDRHDSGVDTLYSRIQDAKTYLTGSPQSRIPDKFLDQIESEAHSLGDRSASNYKNLTDSAINGTDLSAVDPTADPGRVNALAKNRQETFLRQNGYDPKTGDPVGRKPHASTTFPRAVRNSQNGAVATVQNQQEADEAAKEGFQ